MACPQALGRVSGEAEPLSHTHPPPMPSFTLASTASATGRPEQLCMCVHVPWWPGEGSDAMPFLALSLELQTRASKGALPGSRAQLSAYRQTLLPTGLPSPAPAPGLPRP